MVPLPVVDDSLKIDAVKLTIAHKNDLGAFENRRMHPLENLQITAKRVLKGCSSICVSPQGQFRNQVQESIVGGKA